MLSSSIIIFIRVTDEDGVLVAGQLGLEAAVVLLQLLLATSVPSCSSCADQQLPRLPSPGAGHTQSYPCHQLVPGHLEMNICYNENEKSMNVLKP